MNWKQYLRLLRVSHYIKNFLIFAPLLFANDIRLNSYFICLIGFIAFSLTASSVYIINDINDFHSDKKSKHKENSPIQSEIISFKKALIVSIILLIISFVISFIFTNALATIVLIVYFVINFIYTKILKQIPYIEMFCYISFYLLRLYYGALITNLNLSYLIILEVVFSSLFIISLKRINEIKNGVVKEVHKKYNIRYLKLINLSSLILIISIYITWLYLHLYLENVISFVILILILYIYKNDKNSDPISIFYKNKWLILLLFIYLILIIL